MNRGTTGISIPMYMKKANAATVTTMNGAEINRSLRAT